MPSSMSKEPPPRTCPCKLLPKSLSSFTAAEYGDIHSLSKIQNVATRTDDAGYSPLHFTAQFNHVAATAFLLQLGCPVDGGGHCGATPLHRAAFSGATASMKVLLEWKAPGKPSFQASALDAEATFSGNSTTSTPTSATISSKENYCCDLLARDTSFGDESTPLHKAAAGGRYLAVHMILEALKERDGLVSKRVTSTVHDDDEATSSSPNPKPSWLQRGLRAKDRFGRRPLDVARHFFQIQSTERNAVARWDAVAGGSADWEKCVQLLESACQSGTTEDADKADCPSNSHQNNNPNTSRNIPQLPLHLRRGAMACLDCNPIPGDTTNSVCLTTTWQATFQQSLENSAMLCIVANTAAPKAVAETTLSSNTTTSCVAVRGEITKKTNEPKEKAISVHSTCQRCRKPTVAFYQLPGVGTLVCKSCKRLAK